MAALVISISSDVSVESVGFSFLQVILIGFISVKVLVAPEVGAAAVASLVGVLELDTLSSSEVDPSESSPPPVSATPMVLPFLCSYDSESDIEIPERHVSPTASTLEIPTAPILTAPSAMVAPSSEEHISIGRLYHTHPGGPCKALTARKSVRPLPSHRLALRYITHHLDRFTSGSSLSHSSSDHSSSGHPSLDHSLSGYTPPDTTNADSSTPQRFVHPSLARTPRCSEAYLCWRSTLLSTMYPPTTSKSSARDSSSESSAGPSRKKCRSPAATVSIHATRALVPSCADLFLPRKRFRDFISQEDSVKEDIDMDMLEDIETDVTAIEVAVDRDIKAGIYASICMEVDVRIDVEDEVESSDRGTMEVGVDMDVEIDIPDGMLMPDAMKRLEQVEDGLQDICDHVIEIPRIEDIETAQRQLEASQLEAGQLIASEERAVLSDRTRSLERENLKVRALLSIERDRVDSLRRKMALSQEEFRQVRKDRDDTRRKLRSDGDNRNGGNGNGRNENPNENGRGDRLVARECTYQDFMKCQPLNFKGTEGVVRLTRWFEKMKIVFHITYFPEKYQVKYATCTLLNNALTWWNLHKRAVGTDAAFAMSWRELMKLMDEVYFPRNEVQKIEFELWNLTMKNNSLAAYTQRFQELTMLCTRMVLEEEDRIERYVIDLPDNIQGNVMSIAPTRLPDGIRLADSLIDQKLKGYAVKNAENKRRQGYFKSDCLKLKDQNHGNKARNKNRVGEARGKAYVLGGGDAKPNSNVIKEKTKRLHDSKIKDRVFNIGDRVLLFNSRLKIFSSKLKSRWSGPFTISHVYPYDTVELSQPNGPNFKVNGHRLKHYFG
nr:hypothetical protein [Tanacetum cinerariifolium]